MPPKKQLSDKSTVGKDARLAEAKACRRYAAMCEELAKAARNNEARLTYEHLAREWRELADRAEST